MQFGCQCLIVALLLTGFFSNMRACFEGSKSKPPMGYSDFVISLIVSIVIWGVFWAAGAFSELTEFFSVRS